MVKFLLAGSHKCGTSALASFLAQHPQLCMATPKEPHFFDNEALFARQPSGQELLNIYSVFFQNYRSGQLAGEATPIYMYWKPALQRIKQYNPSMKWIFILRNPIERAYSHYMAASKLNSEHLQFPEALRKESERIAAAAPLQDREHSYMDRGYYSQQIKRILREYPKNNMMFVKTDDLKNDHFRTLAKVWDFLEAVFVNEVVASISHAALRPCDFSA